MVGNNPFSGPTSDPSPMAAIKRPEEEEKL